MFISFNPFDIFMEQSSYSGNSEEKNPTTQIPFTAKVFAIFLLLAGAGSALQSALLLFGPGGGRDEITNLIAGIVLIAIAFGIRYMKKWAVIIFAILLIPIVGLGATMAVKFSNFTEFCGT